MGKPTDFTPVFTTLAERTAHQAIAVLETMRAIRESVDLADEQHARLADAQGRIRAALQSAAALDEEAARLASQGEAPRADLMALGACEAIVRASADALASIDALLRGE